MARVLINLSHLQHMGSREDVSARIEADTKLRINEMNKAVTQHKEQVFPFFYAVIFTYVYSLL